MLWMDDNVLTLMVWKLAAVLKQNNKRYLQYTMQVD